MRKDQLLKRLDLVLQLHEIRDCLVPDDVGVNDNRHYSNGSCLPLIRIIDALQGDVFLVLEEAIEFRPKTVESKLRQQKLHICTNQRTIPYAD